MATTKAGRSKRPAQPASSAASIDRRMLMLKIRLHLLTLQARAFRDWYRPQLDKLYAEIPVADLMAWQQSLSDDDKVAIQAIINSLPKTKLVNEYASIGDRLKALALTDQVDRQNVFEGRCSLTDSKDALGQADFDTALSLAMHAQERLNFIVHGRTRKSSRNYRQLDVSVVEVLNNCIIDLEQLIAGLRSARAVAA
jgi:hypothetical protein